jgi:hypothetical protein
MTTLGCAMHTTDVAKGCCWHEHLTLAKTATTVRRRRRAEFMILPLQHIIEFFRDKITILPLKLITRNI